MQDFEYFNPVNIVFGKGKIAEIKNKIPQGAKVLFTYGGGSIKRNGVYEQVTKALEGFEYFEFGGIEPNPEFNTLMKAVQLGKEKAVDFILAVGGGSVVDGSKFIAACIPFEGDAWKLLTGKESTDKATSLGAVLTLPATGSEMNCFAVVSHSEKGAKIGYMNPHVFPKFSVLDPETTYTLSERQMANGIVDAFVHVTEQYLTYPAENPLQDRLCESILQTLVEVGPKIMEAPKSYKHRATGMWSATLALNGLIGAGSPQDWATHMIGHELTALYGIDHARTLAVVLPELLRHQIENKKEKLEQMARRVWGLNEGTDLAEQAIIKTQNFFESLGVPTKLSKYENANPEDFSKLSSRLGEKGMSFLGERQAIKMEDVNEILKASYGN